ncbi:MAG: tetratricopeptide repeat protein [Cocleimonas sp.]|nr:tetratricopeptide repeat protein [Cocleimonas sp.]
MSLTPQKKLFSVPVLILIMLALLVLLFSLFPWKTAQYFKLQDTEALKEQFSNPMKTKYYQMMDSDHPENKEVLVLSDALQQKGLWQASSTLLKTKVDVLALSDPELQQFDFIKLNNLLDAYYTSSDLIRDNENFKNKVRTQLLTLSDHTQLPNNKLQIVAETSADFGLLPLAIKAYYQLAENDEQYRPQWFSEAGKWAASTKDYSAATQAFKQAYDASKNTEQSDQYHYAWLDAALKDKQFKKVSISLKAIKKDQLPQSLEAIEKIAELNIRAGQPELASDIFSLLAQQDKTEKQQIWHEKASYWAAQAKQYDPAIKHLLRAKKVATNDQEKWALDQRLVNLYTTAKKPKQALDLLVPLINSDPKNIRLLNKAVDIALASKNSTLARKINQQHLAQTPDAVDALHRQIEIETFDKKYKRATHYIKQLILVNPKDPKAHQRWADVEEVQGNYKRALALWLEIYKADNNKKHLPPLVRVAQADINDKGLTTLQQLAQQQNLPTQAVHDVFFHLVESDQEEQGEKFLSQYVATHPADQTLLETLAQWYSSKRRFKQSLTTWETLEKQYGTTQKTQLKRFELLWLLRKKRQAYRLWRDNRAQWTKNIKTRYFLIMADIAWRYRHNKEALFYYRRLLNRKYQSTRARAFYYTRIAFLQKKLGKPHLALATFRKGFIRTARSDLLINGLQLSFNRRNDAGFKRLTSLANRSRSRIKSRSRYWILQAAYAQRQKRYRTALRYYKQALRLNPRSREARIAIRAIRRVSW